MSALLTFLGTVFEKCWASKPSLCCSGADLCLMCVSGDSFWVGKASLRSWRQLALDQLEEEEQGTKHNNIQTNGQGPHTNSKGQTFLFFSLFNANRRQK